MLHIFSSSSRYSVTNVDTELQQAFPDHAFPGIPDARTNTNKNCREILLVSLCGMNERACGRQLCSECRLHYDPAYRENRLDKQRKKAYTDSDGGIVEKLNEVGPERR